MASSLSSIADTLAEGMHRGKCKNCISSPQRKATKWTSNV